MGGRSEVGRVGEGVSQVSNTRGRESGTRPSPCWQAPGEHAGKHPKGMLANTRRERPQLLRALHLPRYSTGWQCVCARSRHCTSHCTVSSRPTTCHSAHPARCTPPPATHPPAHAQSSTTPITPFAQSKHVHSSNRPIQCGTILLRSPTTRCVPLPSSPAFTHTNTLLRAPTSAPLHGHTSFATRRVLATTSRRSLTERPSCSTSLSVSRCIVKSSDVADFVLSTESW